MNSECNCIFLYHFPFKNVFTGEVFPITTNKNSPCIFWSLSARKKILRLLKLQNAVLFHKLECLIQYFHQYTNSQRKTDLLPCSFTAFGGGSALCTFFFLSPPPSPNLQGLVTEASKVREW